MADSLPQGTVDIMRGLFPELQDHPPERVELLLLSTTGWQPVMPDVWHTVAEDPPDQLGVRIADLPGQESRRAVRGEGPSASFGEEADSSQRSESPVWS